MRNLITASFFLLAIWFFQFSGVGAIPVDELPLITAEEIATDPRFAIMQDPPMTDIGSLEMDCSSCHAIFPSSKDEPEERLQHLDIVLEHGLNDRCDNCHSRGAHDKLELYGDELVDFDQVQRLCAKCHGPTYRDWENGIHGKTMGSWDVNDPAHRVLLCTECHDPHHPAFQSYKPLRGPHTLRQHATKRDSKASHGGKRNPLRDWQRNEGHDQGAGHVETSEGSH